MKNFFPSRAVSLPVLLCYCSFNLKVKPYNKSFIDQACSVKMAGYWPRSFFAFLWTSTSSRSIKTQKKNLANIQAYIRFTRASGAHIRASNFPRVICTRADRCWAVKRAGPSKKV